MTLHSFSLLSLLAALPVGAADALPSASRNQGYSGHSTTIRGDVRSLGLAGATMGLPDTIQATRDNPAGFAALGTGVAAELSLNSAQDSFIQTDALGSLAIGAGVGNYPWGFTLSYSAPSSEGQVYTIPSAAGDRRLNVYYDELRLTVSRVLWDRVSVGVGAAVQTGVETIDTFSQQASGVGLSGGALIKLPRRFLVGLAAHTGQTMQFPAWNPVTGYTGFFRDLQIPARGGLGVSWIPNRFFRGAFSVEYVAPSSGVALIKNETIGVGGRPTFQPRLGVSYTAIDLRAINAQVSAGTYLEFSRLSGLGDRLHFTAGLELKPWVLFFAWGIDVAYGYNNNVFAGGVDVLKLLGRLGALPREYQPPLGGLFPAIARPSDVGLPRFLVEDWELDPRSNVNAQSVQAIGDHFRDSLGESIENTPSELKNLGEGLVQDIKDVVAAPKPKAAPPKKTKPVKKRVIAPKKSPSKSQRPRGNPSKTSKPKRPS